MRSSRPGRSSRRSTAAWKPSRVSKLSYTASAIVLLACVMRVPCAAPFCDQARERRKERSVGPAPVGELAQEPRGGHRERLAVHQEALAVVEERGLRIEANRGAAPRAGPEHHVGLGRAEVAAEEIDHVAARPADARERFFAEPEELARDARRPRCRGKPRVAVRRIGEARSEEHTSELQSRLHLVCRLLLEK